MMHTKPFIWNVSPHLEPSVYFALVFLYTILYQGLQLLGEIEEGRRGRDFSENLELLRENNFFLPLYLHLN